MPEIPRDPWYEWLDAFAAACARCASEFDKDSETAFYIGSYVGLIERLLAAQPPRPAEGES